LGARALEPRARAESLPTELGATTELLEQRPSYSSKRPSLEQRASEGGASHCPLDETAAAIARFASMANDDIEKFGNVNIVGCETSSGSRLGSEGMHSPSTCTPPAVDSGGRGMLTFEISSREQWTASRVTSLRDAGPPRTRTLRGFSTIRSSRRMKPSITSYARATSNCFHTKNGNATTTRWSRFGR